MDSQSGGKIVTKRHRRHMATPYDRISASSQPAAKSPNWLTRVLVPATRMISSGANKIISTVFDSDESSSSSLSTPDSGHASENDFDNGNPVNPYGTYSLNEHYGTTSEAMKSVSREPQLNSENHAKQVEQLLMQGMFSRQECNRFIEIIKSRVMDPGEDNVPFDTAADGSLGDCADNNLCNKAVMEARKWLEEKKVAFSPISNMADGASGLNSLQIVNEVGSPADVAKQYVKSRSPWGSPSVEHVELQTPAMMTSSLSREGTSLAAGHESLSSFKKRASLASGSWNIQEEIRRVRARATEDMLNSSPSTRNAVSVYASSPNLLLSRGEGKELNSVYTAAPTERTDFDTASRMEESHSLFVIQASAMLDKYRPKTRDECAASNLSPPFPDLSKDDVESRLISLKESMVDRYRKSDVTENATDLPASQAILPTEVNAGETQSEVNEENVNRVKSDAKIANVTTPMEDGSAILSEASVEVPIMDETDAMGNVSLPVSNELGGTPMDEMPAKAEEKKPARSNRRGRGRIKG